jgi:hypothetical protein
MIAGLPMALTVLQALHKDEECGLAVTRVDRLARRPGAARFGHLPAILLVP